MIDGSLIISWLRLTASMVDDQTAYLTDLDAQIGDGDHGINMARGFKKVAAQLPSLQGKDIGAILKATGMALISNVGGASGPLYGSFFLDASKVAVDCMELSTEDWSKLLHAGLLGIQRIGKAQEYDKTIIDALQPGFDAFQVSISQGKSLKEASSDMLTAANQGRDRTIPMIARKGRASYLGERSAGHMDPGAASACILVEAFFQAVSQE